MDLSILIPTLTDRERFLISLLRSIYSQNASLLKRTEILINCDAKAKSIGRKRNELLTSANGKYVVFIDDDDSISVDYLNEVFVGIDKDVDHIGITGIYAPDNDAHKLFKCSYKYEWCERDNIYYRGAQHICPIRSTLAKQIKYPEINFGEDKIYSDSINKIIASEHLIEKPIYEYKYRSNK